MMEHMSLGLATPSSTRLELALPHIMLHIAAKVPFSCSLALSDDDHALVDSTERDLWDRVWSIRVPLRPSLGALLRVGESSCCHQSHHVLQGRRRPRPRASHRSLSPVPSSHPWLHRSRSTAHSARFSSGVLRDSTGQYDASVYLLGVSLILAAGIWAFEPWIMSKNREKSIKSIKVQAPTV